MFDLMPLRNISDYFNALEREFFGENALASRASAVARFHTDIVDKGDTLVLQAELPGFDKKDIKIDIDNDRLTISAEHREESKEEKDSYIRRERRYGAFTRSFRLDGLDAEAITADYRNGVLELQIPKKAPVVPPSRQIEIK